MVQDETQMPDHRIVATIPKGRRNMLRVTIRQCDRVSYIDIRQHEPDAKRRLMPTIKGIGNIDPATARELIAAIEAALARLSL